MHTISHCDSSHVTMAVLSHPQVFKQISVSQNRRLTELLLKQIGEVRNGGSCYQLRIQFNYFLCTTMQAFHIFFGGYRKLTDSYR